jgi:signal transduction histidine kinase
VITTEKSSITSRIEYGKVQFIGYGDLHDEKYSYSGKTYDFTIGYQMTTYLTHDFIEEYHTNGPIIACVISVGIIVFTSIVFIIYDILMNRQALQQKLIIDTRRQFVRFISHEIRTPLNTIHLKNAISL